MRISIVTISFNQASYLERCIQTVLNQSHDDTEYIVVDAGSDDGSRKIIERYRSAISKVIFEPDEGPADGLNKGFEKATGDLFYYLNADDQLLPDALARAEAVFKKDPALDVALGHGVVIDEQDIQQYRIYSGLWSLYNYAIEVARAVQQSTIFRRSAFYEGGGFNTANRTCWDGELLVDMALSGAKVQTINEFLGAFRIHNQSITGSGRFAGTYQKDRERIRRKILGRGMQLEDYFVGWGLRLAYHFRHPIRALEKIKRDLVRQPQSKMK